MNTEEITMNYLKNEKGEVFLSMKDVMDTLKNYVLTSNMPCTRLIEFMDQLEKSKP